MDENQAKIFTLLIDIHDKIGTIKSDIAKIEVDLKEHVRRTYNLEGQHAALSKKLSYHERIFWMGSGAVTLVTAIASGLALYLKLKGS